MIRVHSETSLNTGRMRATVTKQKCQDDFDISSPELSFHDQNRVNLCHIAVSLLVKIMHSCVVSELLSNGFSLHINNLFSSMLFRDESFWMLTFF